MVRRGPFEGDDGATSVFPPARSSRAPGGFDDSTVVLPAIRAPRRSIDDDDTQLLRPIDSRTRPPQRNGTRPPPRTPETPPARHSRQGPPPKKPKSKAKKALRILAIVSVLLVAGFGGMAYGLQAKYKGQMGTFSLGDASASRAPVAVPEAMNILLVGSDSRTSKGNAAGNWVSGDQRTDAMMLVHIAKDRKSVDVVSIPRDSWVEIPEQGFGKINSAYAYGGPARLRQTIEQLSNVHIDHVVIADFTGFKGMTDALGGVEITVPQETWDSRNHFTAGTHLMSGKEALGYVRQRHGLPNGDFDRVKRQQNWIRAVIKQAMSKDTLTNPLKLNSFLDAATKSVSVDDTFDIGTMRDLALSLRSVKPADMRFMTLPNLGTDMEGDQSIVRIDDVKAASFFTAVQQDQMTAWLQVNKPDLLGDTVR
jgi:LCP family protein required for cell wall assembly